MKIRQAKKVFKTVRQYVMGVGLGWPTERLYSDPYRGDTLLNAMVTIAKKRRKYPRQRRIVT